MKAGIAGAGIMGRLLAFTLLREGWDVTLFDKDGFDNASSCSMTAAGLLTPVSELDKADMMIYQLGSEAITLHWPAVIKQLPEEIYFKKLGSLILSHPKDYAELENFKKTLTQKTHGTLLTEFENIQLLEPELTKFQKGYYIPEEAHIDSQHVFKAIGNYLQLNLTHWYDNTFIEKIQTNTITTQDCAHKFDIVFDCRGLGGKNNFSNLRGIRGELIWLHAPQVNISRPIRLLHPRYSLYVVPRPNNIYLVGASEIESEDTSEISVKTTLELLTAAYYLHPDFAEARIIKTAVNLRPTLSDHLPKIKFTEGLIAVNGLYRHGYLIAPTLVNQILLYLKKNITDDTLWERYNA